jgi:hypothetical protein
MIFHSISSKSLYHLSALLCLCFFMAPLSAADELSVKPYHVPKTFLVDIKERMPIIMAQPTYRQKIKGYLQHGGNPNFSFPRTTDDIQCEWTFLHLAITKASSRRQGEESEQQQDIELIRLLIKMKIDINNTDSHGRTALHLAAYSGPGTVIDILLHEGGANPLCFDHLRLLSSDYHVWSHFFNGLTHYKQSSFQDAEEAVRSRYAINNPQQAAFMNIFQRHCEMTLLSNQLLQVNILAKNKAAMSVSGFFNVISNVLPAPLSPGAQALAVAAEIMEDSMEELRRQTYVEHAAQLFNKETVFKNLAYFLATIYESSIQELTEGGASKLGEYAAKKVNKYLESEDFNSVFFIQNIERLLGDLKGRSVLPTKVDCQNGTCIPACEIFNPRLRQVKKGQRPNEPLILPHSGARYDEEEEIRLKILVGLIAEQASAAEAGGEKIVDLSTFNGELLTFLQSYPQDQATSLTSLNLSYHRMTQDVVRTLSQFSSLRDLFLIGVEFDSDALITMGHLSLLKIKKVDWRQNSRTLQSELLLSLFSKCLKDWKDHGLTVNHVIDNDVLYRLGQYHETKREIEDALNFYELGFDAPNKLAFYKLSTQRSRGDDHILRQEYDCLTQLVDLNNIRGQYLMGRLYKNAKRDRHILRTLRSCNIIDKNMDENGAIQYLREQSDRLYRLAAEGGHTRAAQSIALSLREFRETAPGPQIKRQLLEEELKYWKIAARGVGSPDDEAISKVESAPENIAKIEAALHQLVTGR